VGTSIGHVLELASAHFAHIAAVVQVPGPVVMVQFVIHRVRHAALGANADPPVNLLDMVLEAVFVVQLLVVAWTELTAQGALDMILLHVTGQLGLGCGGRAALGALPTPVFDTGRHASRVVDAQVVFEVNLGIRLPAT